MRKILVGTWKSEKADSALWSTGIDEETGRFLPARLIARRLGFAYMAVHPSNGLLYSIGASEQEGQAVTAWPLARLEEGPVSRVQARGAHLCHLTLDPAGRYLFTADYVGGLVESWQLDSRGMPTGQSCRILRKGSGREPGRQASAHPHCVTMAPEGDALWVCDLGTDSLSRYRFHAQTGLLTEDKAAECKLPPGCGPRHMIFDGTGRNAYLLSELSRELFHLLYDDEKGFCVSERLALPETNLTPSREIGAAAIRLTRDGRFLYVSNRGDDSLVCVSLLPEGGFGSVRRFEAGGAHPRDFILCLEDRYLVCACRYDGRLTLFARDADDGALRQADTLEGLADPVCVLETPGVERKKAVE